MTPSAQINQPPSEAKLRLIRRFMVATGLQNAIDSGSFLERYALPGGPMWQSAASGKQEIGTFSEAMNSRFAALKQAYEKHRKDYQKAYEGHINWEFTEAELAEIVAFLEKPVGQHYLDGSWRMTAYVGTDMEELEQQIVTEAASAAAKE